MAVEFGGYPWTCELKACITDILSFVQTLRDSPAEPGCLPICKCPEPWALSLLSSINAPFFVSLHLATGVSLLQIKRQAQ